ncbi:MAG: IS4 family transposase [Lachnospiraceae bacterium]|nr:IS4 family transposase [Lachnospiraceae bacterium]
MIHTVSLYDVLNKRYLDLEVQPANQKNEFRALCSLMDRYACGGFPIFIADRGFSSYNVFAHAAENNVDFVIRAKDINVRRLLRMETLPDSLDTTVEIFLARTQSQKKYRHPELAEQYRYICKNISFDYINSEQTEYRMKLRIVRFPVADGVFENIITSLEQNIFPTAEIKEIYHMRWNIELSFRDLKHTIGTLNFHSKMRQYIEMELWCQLILYNFCSIIIVNTPIKTKGTRHIYQVNFSMAMKICIAFLHNQNSPPDTESLISKYILLSGLTGTMPASIGSNTWQALLIGIYKQHCH